MSDKKNNSHAVSERGSAESYALYYLEEKLGVTRKEVMEAMKAVGTDRHMVEGYLRTHVRKQ